MDEHFSAPLLELNSLRSFAVTAHELNMSRAAAVLHITQPPLSRKISRLESILGVKLFERTANGLALTQAGKEALRLVEPLLLLEKETSAKLARLRQEKPQKFAIGLTTAFEQGIFAEILKELRNCCGNRLEIIRTSSPRLIQMTQKGRLAAAYVALPIEAQGLLLEGTGHAEPLLAALPTACVVAAKERIYLRDLRQLPLFWFAPAKNPAWHEHMRAVFARAEYAPEILEEPEEHDVLLARIAAGEGVALLAQSFAKISRAGVIFRTVEDLPKIELGLAFRNMEDLRDMEHGLERGKRLENIPSHADK